MRASSSNLSSSALNYLEGLEKSSKALRSGGKRRESISEIISKVRRQTSFSRANSDDFDGLNDSFKSSLSSDRGEKLLMLSDTSSSDSEEETTTSRILPKGTPGQSQNGRKSIDELRKLRNSIDQTLIVTPEVMNTPKMVTAPAPFAPKKMVEKTQRSVSPIIEDLPTVPRAPPSTVPLKKSPFKKTIESESSDAESIIFDEVVENVGKSDSESESSSDSSSESSESSSSEESKDSDTTVKQASESESSEESTNESSEESFESESEESVKPSPKKSEKPPSSESEESVKPPRIQKKLQKAPSSEDSEAEVTPKKPTSPKKSKKMPSPKSSESEEYVKKSKIQNKFRIPQAPESVLHQKILSSDGSDSVFRSTPDKPESKPKKPRSLKASKKSKMVESDSELQEIRRILRRSRSSHQKSRRRSKKADSDTDIDFQDETCSTNVHHLMSSMISEHLKMISDFNKIEYESCQEWSRLLKSFQKSSETCTNSKTLQKIVERRLKYRIS